MRPLQHPGGLHRNDDSDTPWQEDCVIAVVVYCLKCKTKLRLPDEAIGRKVRCRHCGAKFVTDEAFLKEEARFRHAERKKARYIKSIRTVLKQIGLATLMLLISPFYVIWVIVKAMWAASEPSLDVPSGRLSGSYSGDSIEEGGIDMPGGSSYASEAKEDSSRCRQYWDSNGRCVGYRDEMGWVHAEDGRSFIGKIDDDGTFYDSSGNYRGQIEEGGAIWVDGKGFVGFQDGDTYSEEGHAGIPDIYEEGGDGTGGAFQSLLG